MIRTVNLSRAQLEALRHFMSARAYVAMYKIVNEGFLEPPARITGALQRFWANNLRVVVPLKVYSLGMEEKKAERIVLSMDTSMFDAIMEALTHPWSLNDFPVETPQGQDEARQELLILEAHQDVLRKTFEDSPLYDPDAPSPNIFKPPQVMT